MNGMEVPHLNIAISENGIIDGAKKLLPILRPDWDTASIRFKIFTDGITNKLLGCFNGSQENDVILIRVYGNKTDLLIDRRAETRNFKLLNVAGLAPRLYATFDSGLVYEYVAGDVVTVDTCRNERVYALTAEKLADMHCIQTGDEGSKEPILWAKLRQFIDLVPGKFSDPNTEARCNELLRGKLSLEREFSFLLENLSSVDSPTVFCHNDLLLGNIIYNSEKKLVTFIDYEYAAFNYQAYDIANHFNEFAGVENVDYSLFPDRDFQFRWLRIYLERYHHRRRSLAEGDGTTDKSDRRRKSVSDEDIESLYNSVEKFTLASHFLWATWALIQAEYSSIDFDFLNYAFIRFNEYYTRKSQIFKC